MASALELLTLAKLAQNAPQSDTTSRTVAVASTAQLSSSYPIQAYDAQVSTSYRLICFGTGTWGTTAQQLQLYAYVGGTLIANAGIPAATFNTGEGICWRVSVTIMITSVGTGGSFTLHEDVAASTSLASSRGNTPQRNSSGNAINTTVSNAVVVQAAWAAGPTGSTITCDGTLFERLGA